MRDTYLRTGEAAARLGVERSTVTAWIRRGHLSARRTPGGRYLVAESEVARLARQMSTASRLADWEAGQ